MISIRQQLCNDCGICLAAVGGYCIDRADDELHIDHEVCNECLRCVSICPRQVFLLNDREPSRATKLELSDAAFVQLVRARRSVKSYAKRPVPPDILWKIAEISKYAPSMNKRIAVLIIDDPELIRTLDAEALRFVRRWYRILFGSRLLTRFFRLFSKTLPTIKKKMERDLFARKRVMKDNTQALILVYGSKRIPVTESSGQYYLSVMTYYAQVLGVGTTLMDSLKLTLNRSGSTRNRMGIPKGESVLGVLSLGYAKERFVNVPEGIQIKIGRNRV